MEENKLTGKITNIPILRYHNINLRSQRFEITESSDSNLKSMRKMIESKHGSSLANDGKIESHSLKSSPDRPWTCEKKFATFTRYETPIFIIMCTTCLILYPTIGRPVGHTVGQNLSLEDIICVLGDKWPQFCIVRCLIIGG